ncbi:MAG: acyl-CoA dehydrogenase [Desulfosarcina sp.]|nr:acyl-CoA dehydrogenase [Desulfosarcina sp.]MBC2767074.1 acyl-CoA dehydrogenase [Desulfosarcina sp.]
MTQEIADRRDIDFVLYEQLDIEQLFETEKYRDLNKKMVEMVVTEARAFGIKEVLPTHAEGDKAGVTFKNGEVIVPECYRRPYQLMVENEWTSLTEDPAVGGQGLPHMVMRAAYEYFIGANYAMVIYALEGHGTGKMIELFGTDKQKELFLKKLYTGQWGGTMDLTEPEAGSDVGALITSARRLGDGIYAITGNKIYITNGEHDLTENIIHPVLARIEGAPAGSKGISIFIVPKIWVNDDGSLSEINDIICTGTEEKMGLHGSATCTMSMGSKGVCRGLLLGEENAGMKIMFNMMNEARLDVGFMGFCNATAAYLYAVNFARERIQGRDLADGKNAEAPSVPIIRHPDVRRMLLWMKAHVEGMRSFIYYVARCFDLAECAADEKERERNEDLIALLTSLIKSYCAERGFEVCIEAMQVHGGCGYTMDYPVEQLARDCKIASIFEGTDGIQAMDLLGRKLGMKKGAVFMDFMGEMKKTIEQAKGIDALKPLSMAMETAADQLGETAMVIGKQAMSPTFKTAFAFAHPFMMAMGDVIMGWMLLWRAAVSEPKLEKLVGHLESEKKAEKLEKDKNAAFYNGQIQSARYYINAVLPVALGRLTAVRAGDNAVLEISERGFGGL